LILIIFNDPKTKSIKLSNKVLNEKFGTANWGINFNESGSRKIDTSLVVNILKVLPKEQEYNGCKYYPSKILEKQDPDEKEMAASLTRQIHDKFPVFKRTFEPKLQQESTRKETDADILAAVELCI
jgi:hypothetical protein